MENNVGVYIFFCNLFFLLILVSRLIFIFYFGYSVHSTKDRLAHVRVLEASRTIQGNPANVTTARRLYITGLLTQVNLSDPQSLSDTRTYLLYNDFFLYCQKVKLGSKKSSTNKLQCKGVIDLKHAEITPLSAKLIIKMSEVKKASALSSFMRKSEPHSSKPAAATLVYGFEIRSNEPLADVISAGYQGDFSAVPGHSSGSNVKRRIVMRTQTESEQNAWMALLRKTSQLMTRKG